MPACATRRANWRDAIITNAAGCGSTLKEYAHLLDDEVNTEKAKDQHRGHRGAESTEDMQKAKQFSGKVRDVIEFLAESGVTAQPRSLARDGSPLRVTYQDSCHLAHGQKVKDAPRKLLRAIPGIELVEMPLADSCCGSAGVYNVTQTAASLAILEEKMQHAASTRASVIATANPGCILQLRAGAALHATGQQVLHVVELLDRALATDEHR
jgi:glycolate oxidase iron-sulfur subunit